MPRSLLLRRGTSAEWGTADPVLGEGEVGVNLTTGGLRVGDGTTAWSGLSEIGAGGGGATNLSYTAATRVLASDTGTDATLPLVDTSNPGLAPTRPGTTTDFLRGDGTWAAPAGGSGLTSPQVLARSLGA